MNIYVIVVTYNGRKWYNKCFGSLRNSTVPVETIVIDNASRDDTVSYIRENFPEIHLIEGKENLGFGKANNIGMRNAMEKNADYVFLLNQDAWVLPDTVEKLCFQAKQNTEYGIISPIHLSGNEETLDFNFVNYISAQYCPNLISDFVVNKKPYDKIYPINFVNAAFWLITKDCLDKIGGFCPLFSHYCEDDNYINRLTYHRILVGVYPLAYAIHDRIKGNFNVTKKKKENLLYVSLLNILCNINISLHKSYSIALYYYIRFCMKNEFSISFLTIGVHTFCKLPLFVTHRNIMRKMNRNYL
jgi:GT2 family glycosyltransferase